MLSISKKFSGVLLFSLCMSLTALSGSSFPDEVIITQSRSFQEQKTGVDFLFCSGASFPVFAAGENYITGIKAGVEGRFSPADDGFLTLHGSLDYLYSPTVAEFGVNTVSVEAGAGIHFKPLSWLSINVAGGGGGYLSMLGYSNEFHVGGNPVASGGVNAGFRMFPGFSLSVGAEYSHYFGFYSGVGVLLQGTVHAGKISRNDTLFGGGRSDLPPIEGEQVKFLDMKELSLDQIFPVFYKYYETNPIGTVSITNSQPFPMDDIHVGFYISEHMDAPGECDSIERLLPGETAEIPIKALFKDSLLNVSEGTKVTVELPIVYSYEGDNYRQTFSDSIRILDRNAMTWDDDRRAAAFVTARDPEVQSFAKNVMSAVKGKTEAQIDKNLKTAIAFHSALCEYNMNYAPDPKTPYVEFSRDGNSVDFLQFPRQTLAFKGGDCDDLSILYSALFESVGIETAFITVPGHIYMAFALHTPVADLEKVYARPEDFIISEGKVWVPLEVTELSRGFINAWDLGSEDWNKYASREMAQFYPIRSGWALYEPVGFTRGSTIIEIPDEDLIAARFAEESERFVSREIAVKQTEIQEKIDRTGGKPRYVNHLGVLYARYGLQAEAEEIFLKLSGENYVPAMINLGNLYFMQNRMTDALRYLKMAESEKPDKPTLLLSIAKTYYEMEDYDTAGDKYSRLQELAPEIADRAPYLAIRAESTERAAERTEYEGAVLWDEE